MIDAARNFGEQISGIRIPKGCRLNDGLSCGLAQCGKRRRNCGHVFLFVGDAEWVNKLYQVCAFDPRAKGCDKVYQYALSDTDNPAAVAVRATYEGYARYLRNLSGLLTDSDLRFLKASQIVLPAGLRPAQKSGLHNVINDSTLSSDAVARVEVVNGFINYAVEANLYCAFNPCNDATTLPTTK